MRWILIISLGLGLGSLAMARYIHSDGWIHFLMATGGFAGLAMAMASAMLIRLWLPIWKPGAAVVLALAAAITRSRLVARIVQTDPAQLQIDFLEISLAISTVIWGALALIWGAMALNDLELRGGARRAMVAPALAVSLALYSISPLLGILWLGINLWTILSLFGLAAVAYGIGAAYRGIARILGAE